MTEQELQIELKEVLTITKLDFLNIISTIVCDYIEADFKEIQNVRADMYHSMKAVLDLYKKENTNKIINTNKYTC